MQDFITAGRWRLSLGLALGALFLAGSVHAASSPTLSDGTPCTAGQKPLRTEPLQIKTARGHYRLWVEMADTEGTRETGLMCRTVVPGNGGMLFDFKTPQQVSFWMRNTIIPLDMLFIAKDGRVVSIARNATPENETPIPSGGAVVGVLELRGGRAAELGAAPGDRVRQRIFHP
ncbi:MAG TPA: DUF192 domain-containing protein [Caulobacteraceae bacterium]